MRHVVLAALLLIPGLFAQRKVDLRNTYQRLLCVVPVIGAGTSEDPRRPEFAPVPKRGQAPDNTGIIAFSWVPSNNGKHALVEFVARDRSAFKAILGDKRADVKWFEKGKAKKADIEQEFRKYRRNFDIQ